MFAQMNHVTVKTLRFYEEQGILNPAFLLKKKAEIMGKIAQLTRQMAVIDGYLLSRTILWIHRF